MFSVSLADPLGCCAAPPAGKRLVVREKQPVMSVALASTATAVAQPPAIDPRTRLLLQGSIILTLLRLAWPNILIMLAQASIGLIETWWVAHLGIDALSGMALVFPVFMMMQMLSAGAMGGGISSAIARALGGGRRADALVLHAIVVNLLLGLTFSVLVLSFGRSLYGALGGEGQSLEAALLYSNVVFAGNGLVWLMNALASVIRGTGNMLVPSLATCIGVVLLVPLSPLLIFGFGPIPALGIAGAGVAVILTTALTAAVLAWYIGSGRSVVRMRLARLRPSLFGDILRVGAVGSISTLQTTLTVALTTALVGAAAGPDAIAGYGTGARLEYLLIPLVFGLGAPLVALVGTNIGAGERARALRIALIGGALAFGITEMIGLAAAIWPYAWLGLFSGDPRMLDTGAAYLRSVGPAYGFFGLGLSLYFASQGAARLFWPLFAGLLRLLIAVGGGWIVLSLTGSLAWVFAALAVALVVYGLTLAAAVASGAWFRGVWPPGTPRFRIRMLIKNELPLGAADRQVERAA
jgi:putative MATE family efflux protein